ncbi:MAG: IS3 family transposase [Tissierellia bacterium]|jgi:putative transposase|nr:IS3 family transposase [Tissierellia bacterium]
MYLYNKEIISYSLSIHPTINFTNKSLKTALNLLPKNHCLTIHSDQGFHYQHKSWIKELGKYKVNQSMSRRGNCLDNSPMENFFGILKQEMFYGVKFNSISELERTIKKYIYWYNNERIKEKLNGMSPVEYRKHTA